MGYPFGVLFDIATGELLGPATATQLRYAAQSPDNILRVDSRGQPYANGSSAWLREHTRQVQIRAIPEGALHRALDEEANFREAARPEPKLLTQTSASMGMLPWEYQRRQDLEVGSLSVVELNGQRTLVFSGRRPELFTLEANQIATVTKVASGFNVIVDVIFGATIAEVAAVCFVGPRGRMKTIFATLGHPI